MDEPKTKPTDVPVTEFICAIPDEQIRQDCWVIVEIMQDVSQTPPKMYHQIYPNGKGSDWPLIGFSPRKQAITFYLNLGGMEHADELLDRLGKHTRSKGCLYLKHLSDVDLPTLKEIINESMIYSKKTKLLTLP
jgi:hypothetical protein